MKHTSPSFLNTSLRLLALSTGLLLYQNLPATGVVFGISPGSVSNTYRGVITLQISGGLTNGETVLVQKFLDGNANGIIDAGDWLIQQFPLTDGQAGMVIGGVINSNVPGDTDTTPGQITAKLNFANGDFMQNVAGNFLFKLSSPVGHFLPQTNLFVVTNLPYGQKITGNVVSNGTSTVVPNAMVLLFPPPRPGKGGPSGQPIAGTMANSSGAYSLPAPPGTYMPTAFYSTLLANFNNSPVVALSGGATLTTNLSLTNATASISGTVVDAANSNLALPGVLVSAESTNGLMGVGFAGTNGAFTLPAQPGPWSVHVDDTALIIQGRLGLQNRPTVNAGTLGIELAYPRATALFYGQVKDSLGNPLVGIDVYVQDNNNQYETDGYADANGNYFAGAVGDLNGDSWQASVSSDSSPTNYMFSQPAFDQNGGTNLSPGMTVPANFTALLATNHITGYLKDNNNNPISGVNIWANATINGTSFGPGVNTDTTGYYSINVGNGTWTVGVSCGGGDNSLSTSYMCPGQQSVTISNNNSVVNFVALREPSQIGGVLTDNNSNPIANAWTYAYDPNGINPGANGSTDGSGHFTFGVTNGTWNVGISCGPGGSGSLETMGYLCVSEQTVSVTNSTATVNFVAPQAPYQLTGWVRDNKGQPLAYVDVYANATINGSTFGLDVQTDSDGNYSFNVANGLWDVSVDCGELSGNGNLCPGDQLVGITNGNGVAGFTAPAAAYQLTGWVKDNNNQPLASLDVYANATINGTTFGLDVLTDNNGNYSFNVSSGLWDISLDCGELSGRGYQCANDQSVNISNASAALDFTVTNNAPSSDVLDYYAMKQEAFFQTGPSNVIPDTNHGPFNAIYGIVQSSLGTVPIANLDLPLGGQAAFPPGSSGLELEIYNTFSSQQALDGAYPAGNYTFAMATMDNGFQSPVLAMPVLAYPAAQRVSNYAAAQAINPSGSFMLQWSNPPDATTNDYTEVFVTDANGSLVFSTAAPATNLAAALNGTVTSVVMPANTFKLGAAYTGVVSFIRITNVNATGYPGAVGVTCVSVRTRLPLVTLSAAPVLSQPARKSGSVFSFQLSGLPGQTYTILASTNLAKTNWVPVLTTNLSSSPALIQDNQATNKQRFYRARVGQ